MGPKRLLLILVSLGAVSIAQPAGAVCNLGLIAELPLTRSGGDSEIQVKINGADAKMIIDTGAFFSVVTPAAAARLKMPPTTQEYDMRMVGVGGTTSRVSVRLARDLNIAGAQMHNVDFELGETELGDADGLLGQNLLAFPEVEYDLGHDVMRFFKPNGCVTEPLAYWATSQPYSAVDIETHSRTQLAHISGYALINGVRMRVDFDTGSPTSIITLAAAAQAGVKPFDPGVFPAGKTSGIAKNSEIQVWNAPFASFKLGDEEIKNVRLFIGPLGLGDSADMLLGGDFFRTHRVLVSYTQNKLYFTYGGGQVFAASMMSSAPGSDQPLDAKGLRVRANQETLDGKLDAAIADLTKAMSLQPQDDSHVARRGEVYRLQHKLDLALADFDQSLKQHPANIWVLLDRASLKFQMGDNAGAKADLEAAAELAAKDPSWGLAIGEAYSAQDQYDQALPWLDRWITASPRDYRMPQALNSRCWSRAMLGRDLTQALADCTAGLKLLPGEPNLLDSRGLVRLRLRDFDGSIADYNAAIAAHPDVAWSFYGRAMAELNKGMTSEGEDDERRAKRLEPDIAATAAKWGVTPPSL
jgi:tetratricopeptide (TPR) repeat protein/predicted aspartyl protease